MNLGAGSYTFQARDANDCIANFGPVVLTEPALPVLGVLVNRINTDCVTSAGEITLGGSGGVGPYTFSLDGMTYTADSTFIGLPPGAYLGLILKLSRPRFSIRGARLETNGSHVFVLLG